VFLSDAQKIESGMAKEDKRSGFFFILPNEGDDVEINILVLAAMPFQHQWLIIQISDVIGAGSY